jgi:hypothetical protein
LRSAGLLRRKALSIFPCYLKAQVDLRTAALCNSGFA